VVSALNHAISEERELEVADLTDWIEHQVPLSRTMSEEVYGLREWARLRARPASKRED